MRVVGRAVEELAGELVPHQPPVAGELAQRVLGADTEQVVQLVDEVSGRRTREPSRHIVRDASPASFASSLSYTLSSSRRISQVSTNLRTRSSFDYACSASSRSRSPSSRAAALPFISRLCSFVRVPNHAGIAPVSALPHRYNSSRLPRFAHVVGIDPSQLMTPKIQCAQLIRSVAFRL